MPTKFLKARNSLGEKIKKQQQQYSIGDSERLCGRKFQHIMQEWATKLFLYSITSRKTSLFPHNKDSKFTLFCNHHTCRGGCNLCAITCHPGPILLFYTSEMSESWRGFRSFFLNRSSNSHYEWMSKVNYFHKKLELKVPHIKNPPHEETTYQPPYLSNTYRPPYLPPTYKARAKHAGQGTWTLNFIAPTHVPWSLSHHMTLVMY